VCFSAHVFEKQLADIISSPRDFGLGVVVLISTFFSVPVKHGTQGCADEG